MISVVIPWFNRAELKQSLPSIISCCNNIESEVVVVNLGGDRHILRDQVKEFIHKIKILNVSGVNGFNKPTAQNIGASHTKYPYLFFCDCDILFTTNVITTLLKEVVSQENTFGTLHGVQETIINSRKAGNIEMFGYSMRLRIKDGTEVNIIDNEEDAINGTRQAPGILLVSRKAFEKVEGYNSALDGWGWEDQDMICRLVLYAKLNRIYYGTALHISHDDKSRMLGYINYQDRWQSRDIMFRRALSNYDKNDFLGTYSKDISTYTLEFGTD
jgi:predicted glycosyltransferase involved in capsule biosynthesis